MRSAIALLFIVAVSACRPADSFTIPHDQQTVVADSIHHDSIAAVETVPHYDFTSFIPKHYGVFDSVIGDLNLDPYPDAIVVLHSDKEEPHGYGEFVRPILLLLGDSSGGFQLALRNDRLTMEQVDGQMFGEPFAGIEIDSGTFRVNHYGGSRYRWTQDYVFTYNPAKKSWFYTISYSTISDMLGEYSDLDSLGWAIPYGYDTLVPKSKTDVRKFDITTAPAANANE